MSSPAVSDLTQKFAGLAMATERNRLSCRTRSISIHGTLRPMDIVESVRLVDDPFTSQASSCHPSASTVYTEPSQGHSSRGLTPNATTSCPPSPSPLQVREHDLRVGRRRTQSCPARPTKNEISDAISINGDSHLRTRGVPPRIPGSPRFTTPITSNRSISSQLPPPSPPRTPRRPGKVQCSGWAKTPNRRCAHWIEPTPSTGAYPDEQEIGAYRSAHTNELLAESGFKTKGGYVKFSEWIPVHVGVGTQIALRKSMKTAPSKHDKWGKVYAYEIQDQNGFDPNTVSFKIGSSVDISTRLDSWKRQCPSHVQKLCGQWPALLGDRSRSQATIARLMKTGPNGPFCRKVERLVHLELGDLVEHRQYLHPNFTLTMKDGVFASSEEWRKQPASRVLQKCSDCGKMHRDIHKLNRVSDKEWDIIVQPIIARWGAFVEAHVDRPDPGFKLSPFYLVLLPMFIPLCIICMNIRAV